MPPFPAYPVLLLVSVLPRVEDPFPDEIGLGVLFAGAGIGGVLADVVHSGSAPEERDQAIRTWGRFGFIGGANFYALSLFVQIGFSS
jgi:hypothetical protein